MSRYDREKVLAHVEAESRLSALAASDVAEKHFDLLEEALEKHGGATPQRMVLAGIHLAAVCAKASGMKLELLLALAKVAYLEAEAAEQLHPREDA